MLNKTNSFTVNKKKSVSFWWLSTESEHDETQMTSIGLIQALLNIENNNVKKGHLNDSKTNPKETNYS